MAIIYTAIIFFFLGPILIYISKKKVKDKDKKRTLLIMGVSASGFLTSIVLHNFLYALGVLSENIPILHYLFEFLHAAFFLIGIIVCPIVFIIGLFLTLKLIVRSQD